MSLSGATAILRWRQARLPAFSSGACLAKQQALYSSASSEDNPPVAGPLAGVKVGSMWSELSGTTLACITCPPPHPHQTNARCDS
jgi:hypothetical protein